MAVKNVKKESETLSPKILDDRIKSKEIGGLYCFFGEEEYMADYYAKRMSECAGFDADYTVFDPDNFDMDLFRESVISYSIETGGFKIAVVKNCGSLKLKSGEKEELTDFLTEYADDIKKFACVIFKYKTLEDSQPRTSRAAKTKKDRSLTEFLKDNAELFEFKVNPKASLVKWLKKICASENTDISEDCAEYILNRSEPFMYPLKNDSDKLIRYAQSKGAKIITKEDIDSLLPKKTEMEAFELTNAILDRNYGKAFESLEKLKYFKEEPVTVLGQISRHFSDLLPVNLAYISGSADNVLISKKTGIHEYKVKLTLNSLRKFKNPSEFIKNALNLCRECDIKLKSTQLDEYNLLENLIFNIAQLR
jgi:DNA polymerase III delta subunit